MPLSLEQYADSYLPGRGLPWPAAPQPHPPKKARPHLEPLPVKARAGRIRCFARDRLERAKGNLRDGATQVDHKRQESAVVALVFRRLRPLLRRICEKLREPGKDSLWITEIAGACRTA